MNLPAVPEQQSTAVSTYLPPISGESLVEMQKSMESFDNVQLPVIRGMKDGHFEFPGDESPQKEFVGTILFTKKTNVYFEGKYKAGEKTIPRCFAPDGMIPTAEDPISPTCEECPMNKFEFKDPNNPKKVTGPKPCKNTRPLFILTEGGIMPWILRTPPSSLKLVADYCTGLLAMGRMYKNVKTRFSLFKAKPADTHWSLKLTMVGKLTAEEQDTVKKLERLWISTMSEMVIDVGEEDEGTVSNEPKATEEPSRDF